MSEKPSILDEVADMIRPLTQARQFLANLPPKEHAEWVELLRRGDLYPMSAVVRVLAKRGIVLDKHSCHKLRTEQDGYVPSR